MDVSEIIPRLWVGSHPRTAEDVRELRNSYGISALLNLQTHEDFEYLKIDWQLLLAHYHLQGIEVRRVSVRDFDEDDLRRLLPQCVKTLKELLDEGHTVLVHCSAGTGRSPAVVIAYLHRIRGWELDRAERHVKSRRYCSPNMRVIRQASRDRF